MHLLRQVVGRITTPLLPDDYLKLANPLWSARELRGRVLEVRRETVVAGVTQVAQTVPGHAQTQRHPLGEPAPVPGQHEQHAGGEHVARAGRVHDPLCGHGLLDGDCDPCCTRKASTSIGSL